MQKRCGTSSQQKGARRNISNKGSLMSNIQNSKEESPSIDLKGNLIDGMRIKMVKRYNQKSKAANVLSNIGFPQKKYKLLAEMGKIQKVVGSKLDEDDRQFLDLLSETSQSFFRNLNNFSSSMCRNKQILQKYNHTEYGSKAFLKEEENEGLEDSYIPREEQRSVMSR